MSEREVISGVFACGHGHVLRASNADGSSADLTGYFCPLCMGAIVGHEKMIDLRVLAPIQEEM